MICVAIVLSALAYGTVHYWALALFNLGGVTILLLWVLDAWTLGIFRVSRNALQLPLLGIAGPRSDSTAATTSGASGGGTASHCEQSVTRSLFNQAGVGPIGDAADLFRRHTCVYRHAASSAHLVRTIMVFGFLLAIFGLTQSFTSPTKVYWIRELNQSTAFGPFINRHHFAGLHGADDCVAVGFAVCRRGRKREEDYLSVYRGTDGSRSRDDGLTRRNHQSGALSPVPGRCDGDLEKAE